MAFIVPVQIVIPENLPPVYDHGYSEEEVIQIKAAKKLIEKRNLVENPTTREEFRTIIVPWQRIHRTEQFILHPVKEKVVRVPKEKVIKPPREAKIKKLTKAQINAKISSCLFKLGTGEILTDDESSFLKEHTTGL
jgi:hypothetical protein